MALQMIYWQLTGWSTLSCTLVLEQKHGKGVVHNGEWRMLILDGHGSHLTMEFMDYCWDHKIVPFLLPPHLTHLLQPCDVGIFQPIKHTSPKYPS